MTPGAWRVPHPTSAAEEPKTDDLLETTGGAIPVRILIVQDGVMTGWDDGALGFDADAVWFSGRATSFRVFARDLLPRLSNEGRGLEDSFYLAHPTRTVVVNVAVLPAGERDLWRDGAFLDTHLVRLRRDRASDGTSQYPPLVPRPGLVRRQWPLPRSVHAAAPVIALALFFGTGSLTFLTLALVAAALWALGSLFQDPDHAALRRIADEERRP